MMIPCPTECNHSGATVSLDTGWLRRVFRVGPRYVSAERRIVIERLKPLEPLERLELGKALEQLERT